MVLERAKAEVLALALTALSKKPRDEKVLVEVGLALKAVTASKRMAGTVAARVHLVLIKVLAAAVEVSVEIVTVRVVHVVSVVEAVGDLAKAAALEGAAAAAAALGIRLKMTRSKMVLEMEGLVLKRVVALEVVVVVVVVGLAVVVVVAGLAVVVAAAAALERVVVVVAVAALEEVVVFQVVMMGKMVVAEVVALAAVVVVVDVGSVVKMVTLQENVPKRRGEVVVELVIPVVKRDTFQETAL